MRQQTKFILAITILTLFPSALRAERAHEKPDDATHVATGTVQRIYTRETKTQTQYIVEIKVDKAERPASLKSGDLLSVYCFQAKEVKPPRSLSDSEKVVALLTTVGESGHLAVPKEGQQIRASAQPRHGRLEALYPDWFSLLEADPQEKAGDGVQSRKSIGFHLLERGKPIRGVTREDGLQLNESGKGPLSYVHIKPAFEITKEKIEKLKSSQLPTITLTPKAAAELSKAMKAAQASSKPWFVMMMNGEKLNGRWSTRAFMNKKDIVVIANGVAEQFDLKPNRSPSVDSRER